MIHLSSEATQMLLQLWEFHFNGSIIKLRRSCIYLRTLEIKIDIIHWTLSCISLDVFNIFLMSIQLRICSDNTFNITEMYNVFVSIILSCFKDILHLLSPPCFCCFCQNVVFKSIFHLYVCVQKEKTAVYLKCKINIK